MAGEGSGSVLEAWLGPLAEEEAGTGHPGVANRAPPALSSHRANCDARHLLVCVVYDQACCAVTAMFPVAMPYNNCMCSVLHALHCTTFL